ncbi:MAG: C_GCAxxG_C_C family protein, partial [Lentisphaeria bacterium]|nr:C_GCAxxG_C_C family protein [Lentisphaeria bacterium]
KDECYNRIGLLAEEFKKQSGGDSIICRELLSGVKTTSGSASEERTQEYYKKRPCVEFVRLAAQIAAKM